MEATSETLYLPGGRLRLAAARERRPSDLHAMRRAHVEGLLMDADTLALALLLVMGVPALGYIAWMKWGGGRK